MLIKIRSRLMDRERGSGELFAVLIFTPMALFMLFMLINFSAYFQTKASVQQAAQSGARLLALYGGAGTNARVNTSGTTVVQSIRNIVYPGGKCAYSACSKAPVITCNPPAPALVTQLGEVVSCTIEYWYTPVVTSDPYGFSAAVAQPFTVTGSYIAETTYK